MPISDDDAFRSDWEAVYLDLNRAWKEVGPDFAKQAEQVAKHAKISDE